MNNNSSDTDIFNFIWERQIQNKMGCLTGMTPNQRKLVKDRCCNQYKRIRYDHPQPDNNVSQINKNKYNY